MAAPLNRQEQYATAPLKNEQQSVSVLTHDQHTVALLKSEESAAASRKLLYYPAAHLDKPTAPLMEEQGSAALSSRDKINAALRQDNPAASLVQDQSTAAAWRHPRPAAPGLNPRFAGSRGTSGSIDSSAVSCTAAPTAVQVKYETY